MRSLFENRHYTWALFVGHLVLEKLLKALYVKNIGLQVPRIHNLLKIAKICGLQMSDEQEDFFLEVTTYNIKRDIPTSRKAFSARQTRNSRWKESHGSRRCKNGSRKS